MSVRRITNGGRKVIGKFPSRKMNKAVWWESPLERDYIFYLEIDPNVISYKEQPLRMNYILDGKVHRYTPDFLVERPGGKQIVEVKDEKSAGKEEYRLLFQLVAPLFQRDGFEFIVVTDKMIRIQPVLDDIKLLYKYSGTAISYKHRIDTYAFFTNAEEGLLGDLVSFLASKGSPMQVAYALIYWGILSVDLSKPINSESMVRLSSASSLIKEKVA